MAGATTTVIKSPTIIKKTRFACASVTGTTAHAPRFAGEAELKGKKRSTVERGAVERRGCGNCVVTAGYALGNGSIFVLWVEKKRLSVIG